MIFTICVQRALISNIIGEKEGNGEETQRERRKK
jgi:hypothetical protein